MAPSAPPASYASGLGPVGVAVGDLNRDGNLDLAVTNLYTGQPGAASGDFAVLFGHGDGSFVAADSHNAGGFPVGIAIGDMNADGKPDLVVANNGGAVSVILNNGGETFAAPISYQAGTNPSGIAVGDLNADGKLDIAVANGTISIFLNVGDGTLSPAINVAAGTNPDSVAIGDLNQDGSPDLAVANGGGKVSTLFNNGKGAFAVR